MKTNAGELGIGESGKPETCLSTELLPDTVTRFNVSARDVGMTGGTNLTIVFLDRTSAGQPEGRPSWTM